MTKAISILKALGGLARAILHLEVSYRTYKLATKTGNLLAYRIARNNLITALALEDYVAEQSWRGGVIEYATYQAVRDRTWKAREYAWGMFEDNIGWEV